MAELSDKDIEALEAVVATEVGRSWGGAVHQAGVDAIVDTVINRVQSDQFPDTVSEVIDQYAQFSGINSRLATSVGSWRNVPERDINAKTKGTIRSSVQNAVTARATGSPSIVAGHLNYANPLHSGANAKKDGWVVPIMKDPYITTGTPKTGEYHVHGTAKGFRPVNPEGVTLTKAAIDRIAPPTPSPKGTSAKSYALRDDLLAGLGSPPATLAGAGPTARLGPRGSRATPSAAVAQASNPQNRGGHPSNMASLAAPVGQVTRGGNLPSLNGIAAPVGQVTRGGSLPSLSGIAAPVGPVSRGIGLQSLQDINDARSAPVGQVSRGADLASHPEIGRSMSPPDIAVERAFSTPGIASGSASAPTSIDRGFSLRDMAPSRAAPTGISNAALGQRYDAPTARAMPESIARGFSLPDMASSYFNGSNFAAPEFGAPMIDEGLPAIQSPSLQPLGAPQTIAPRTVAPPQAGVAPQRAQEPSTASPEAKKGFLSGLFGPGTVPGIAGTLAGTAIAGPIGGLIGGLAGRYAGPAISNVVGSGFSGFGGFEPGESFNSTPVGQASAAARGGGGFGNSQGGYWDTYHEAGGGSSAGEMARSMAQEQNDRAAAGKGTWGGAISDAFGGFW